MLSVYVSGVERGSLGKVPNKLLIPAPPTELNIHQYNKMRRKGRRTKPCLKQGVLWPRIIWWTIIDNSIISI